MNNKSVSRFASLPFIASGLVFIIIGILMFNYFNNFIKTSHLVIASATKVETIKTTAMYKIDGIEYYFTYFNLINKPKVGDRVDLYCSNIDGKCIYNSKVPNVFVISGGIIFILSLISFIVTNRKFNKYLNISNNNLVTVSGKIVGVEVDTSVERDGINPYYITLMAVNPISKSEMYFRSEDIWFDVSKILSEKNIQYLNIKVDSNNADNYSVDISTLTLRNR